MINYLILIEDKYIEASSMHEVIMITKDLRHDNWKVYNISGISPMSVPQYMASYNETRGELEVFSLSGDLLFSVNDPEVMLKLDTSQDPDNDIYSLLEVYYSDVLEAYVG